MNTEREERDAIRRGLAVITDQAPPAPDLNELTTATLTASRHRPSHFRAFATAAVAVLAVVGVVAIVGRNNAGQISSGSGSEFARVLIDNPDWTVTRYDESRGEMADGHPYHYAETTFAAADGTEVELRLFPGGQQQLDVLIADRDASGSRLEDAAAMGSPVAIVRYDAPADDYAAMWLAEGVVYEVRGQIGEDQLRALLDDVVQVSEERWLAALPESVPTDREGAVRAMLADVPIPPGLDTTALYDGDLRDRYQLGAEVTGAVACAWIHQWISAGATGDEEAQAEAVEAMATSHDWDILLDMQEQGAWPQVLWEYADAITGDGTVMGGRVLTVEESVDDALGCGRQ
jgi:hypothetical protein